jgi:hypothetical protein
VGTIAGRGATPHAAGRRYLRHELVDDAMEAAAVIVAALDQLAEPPGAERGPVRVHLEGERCLRRFVQLDHQLDSEGRRHRLCVGQGFS